MLTSGDTCGITTSEGATNVSFVGSGTFWLVGTVLSFTPVAALLAGALSTLVGTE